MDILIPSAKAKFTLVLPIYTGKAEEIAIIAKDTKRPSTYFLRRKGKVNGNRTFYLKFPQSPDQMLLTVYNTANANYPGKQDKSFVIKGAKLEKLKTCSSWVSDFDTDNFVKFAQQFTENASILSPGVYVSDNNKFAISYMPVIRDKATGAYLSTPARIGHQTGVIEVGQRKFMDYSVPMRMIILLHEFSHKFMNEKNGHSIKDETAADINALYIYLRMGYPRIEAYNAFLNVFKHANNEGNAKRLRIINDFITKFDDNAMSCSVKK